MSLVTIWTECRVNKRAGNSMLLQPRCPHKRHLSGVGSGSSRVSTSPLALVYNRATDSKVILFAIAE